MAETTCPQCDRVLGKHAPHGLCPACLLEALGDENADADLYSDGPRDSKKEGRYFGNYELWEKIGQGGMGVVYKARQLGLGRWVALKMILGGKLAGAKELQRFRAEAQAVAILDHPNILPVYEVGEHQGQQFFTMKLIQGGSLAQVLARKPGGLPHEDAVRIVAAAARGVHCAHEHGILHRDLKPANILIDADGRPHISDFGLAKNVRAETDPTLSGTVMGTPAYIAPEQAAGRVRDVSTAADVYSLGAIFYELLTGRAPFSGRTPVETLRKVTDDEAVRPRSINRRCDRDLETICLRCLEKDPRRRYGSAQALGEDLERWLGHEPIIARRISMTERSWKWARRRPAMAALLATVLVALIAIATISTTLTLRLAAQTRAVEHQAEKTRLEAARSLQTASFLKEMIGTVWPSVARGKDTGLFKDALQEMAKRLSLLKGQPAVEIDLRLTFARVYQELGLFKEQEDMSREAALLARAHLGDRHVLLVRSLLSQAYAIFSLGHNAEALDIYDEILAIQTELHGADHPAVAWVYCRMADVHISTGGLDASEALWTKALLIQEEAGLDGLAGYTHLCLARIKLERRELAAAEAQMHRALELQKGLFGDVHPSVAEVLRWMSKIPEVQGNLLETEKLQRNVLEILRNFYGPIHHQVAFTLASIARLQQARGDFDGAEKTLGEALEIEKQDVGEEHQFVAKILHQFGSLSVARANPAQAEEYLRSALAMYEKVLGPDHSLTGRCRADLASLLQSRASE